MTQYHHTVPPYFVRPDHPITIILIGLGGTGSLLLTKLAQINSTLMALQHPGIQVAAWDGDIVTEANIGRQNFFPADLDRNKAEVLIERVNRAFGFGWVSVPDYYPNDKTDYSKVNANIFITCVDSAMARERVHKRLTAHYTNKILRSTESREINFIHDIAYWMDIGNTQNSGQIILGTPQALAQPKDLDGATGFLPTIMDLYPDLHKYENPDLPSCSVAESLQKQDLMINGMMAMWAGKLLWDMFRKIRIQHSGVYVNLNTYQVNPMPITPFDLFESVIKKPKKRLQKK